MFRKPPPLAVYLGAVVWLLIAAIGGLIASNRENLAAQDGQERARIRRLHGAEESRLEQARRQRQLEADRKKRCAVIEGRELCCPTQTKVKAFTDFSLDQYVYCCPERMAPSFELFTQKYFARNNCRMLAVFRRRRGRQNNYLR